MSVSYRLVAYDSGTERLVESYAIPVDHLEEAKKIAAIHPDHDGAGSYPLQQWQARDIAGILGLSIKTEGLDFFVEPFAEPKRPSLLRSIFSRRIEA